MCYRQVLLILAVSLIGMGTAVSQSDSTIYRIKTTDGNTYFGVILEGTDSLVRFDTRNIGTISIPRHSIDQMTPIAEYDEEKDEFWLPNPQETRYFWQPSGYGLKKGEGYYQNIWVLFNHVSYGVSDNFTFGAGTLPLFLFAGTATPVWITPKVSLPIVRDKFNMGIGAMVGYLIGEDGFGFGIPYAVATFGSRNSNLTFGMGWAYSEGDFAERPTLTLSGTARVSRSTYLLMENYFIDFGSEGLGLIILGGRTVTKSVGIDYGLMIPVADIGSFLAIPWLGVTVPFGNKPAYR